MSTVILTYPPVSSVWHLPVGIAHLTSFLRERGHEVLQRYGHVSGVEHVLEQRGGAKIDHALRSIRNKRSPIQTLFEARKLFEDTSRSISNGDTFTVERNNVRYLSAYDNGTWEGLFRAVDHREENLWFNYFTQGEIPIAVKARADVYGISVADERQLVPGVILASLVKEACPGVLVVLGGNFWTRVREAFSRPEAARLFDFCDAVVYREGFRPMEELVAALNPARASGTIWRDGEQVIVNPPAPDPIDFDSLPTPTFEQVIRQWSPEPVYPLYTMSNCPMRCSFCGISAGSDSFLGTPRAMTPRRVAAHMTKLGSERFDIQDETFAVRRQLELGEELRRIGRQATWQCYLTVTNDLLDPVICERLAAAGCRAVQLGLESLSRKTLRLHDKGWNNPETYGKILRNLREVGIQTHVFILVGLPGEPLHFSLRWLTFLEGYGDAILTIKSGRYRVTRGSPDEQGRNASPIIVLPDQRPLRLNRDFRYQKTLVSGKRIDAGRDVLEEACRRHWAYGVTSTIPWWINRGQYSWEELRMMASALPSEEAVPDIDRLARRVGRCVREELNVTNTADSFESLRALARSI